MPDCCEDNRYDCIQIKQPSRLAVRQNSKPVFNRSHTFQPSSGRKRHPRWRGCLRGGRIIAPCRKICRQVLHSGGSARNLLGIPQEKCCPGRILSQVSHKEAVQQIFSKGHGAVPCNGENRNVGMPIQNSFDTGEQLAARGRSKRNHGHFPQLCLKGSCKRPVLSH